MAIWAIGDLHLAFGTPHKSMEVFGTAWKDYANRIKTNWEEKIKREDLILIPGDISWAMKPDEALIDLKWIDALPGTKVILKGNHDYWWPSNKKLTDMLPPSIHFVHNNVFNWNGVTIGGTRLWDTEEYSFIDYILFQENSLAKPKTVDKSEQEKIFEKELCRLRRSLEQLDPSASLRIALTHYPPIGADLKDSKASKILEEFNIDICAFGHLHSIKKESTLFGEKKGTSYFLTSADYLDFTPFIISR